MSAGLQLPLSLRPPRRPGFDNFRAGPNAGVVETLRRGLEPGGWYFLAGPAGCGRTHLALAVYGQLQENSAARFLPLMSETGPGLLDSVQGSDAAWVVMDDVDRLAGDQAGERALFNLLNRLRDAGAGVLMTGTGRDGFRLPDLRSRLGQAARLTLRGLDEADLAALIAMVAAELDVVLGRGVADYLVRRGPRNPGELVGLMRALASRAQSERRVVSVPLAREVLGAGG